MPRLLLVQSLSAEGFRRAGISFTKEGVKVDADTISEERLEAILREPNLHCEPFVESEEEAVARRAAQAEQEKLDKDALAREKKAKTGNGKAALWAAATARALATAELTTEAFDALSPSDRVARIEAAL